MVPLAAASVALTGDHDDSVSAIGLQIADILVFSSTKLARVVFPLCVPVRAVLEMSGFGGKDGSIKVARAGEVRFTCLSC